MKIIESEIKVQKSAFYYTNGSITDQTRYIWIVCHGYAQRADRIINKFNMYNSDVHHIVSVEGLSKFYWKGVTGEIVASWMTSKNRLSEIEDFCTLLNQIYLEVITPVRDQVKVILFGFSQGSATVFRWMHHSRVDADILVSYAGWIPEDINFKHLNNGYLDDITKIHIVGDKDQYLNAEREVALKEIEETNGWTVYWHKYEGDHSINREVLQDIMTKYID